MGFFCYKLLYWKKVKGYMAIKIGNDLSQIENLKVLDERQTRKKLFDRAKSLGIEKDLTIIFNKYDNLMRNCPDEKERADIGKLGAFEVYNLFNRGGELYINGKLVHKS